MLNRLKTLTKSEEFKAREKLIELQKEADKIKHEMKMDELKYIRENEAIKHDKDMEAHRIRNADIKRTIAQKQAYRGYS